MLIEVTIDGKPFTGSVRLELTSAAPLTPSPTGREPRIGWSPAFQARWERAWDMNHPWWQWLDHAVAFPNSAYFDKELFPVLKYQITGLPAHARQAWNQLADRIERGQPSQDIIRANWIKWLVASEWLYPALTDVERSQFAAWSDGIAAEVADTPLADSDRLVTAYFGLRVWHALSGKQPPDTAAMEERLIEYALASEGGEFIEGVGYNSGTVPTLLEGLAACRDLGLVVPAELTALAPQFATAQLHRLLGDVDAEWAWGATQDPGRRRSMARYDLYMPGWAAMAEAADSDELRNVIARVLEKDAPYGKKPRAAFYLFGRPDFQTTRSQRHLDFHVAHGQQMLYARSSWEPDATSVMFRTGRFNAAHHPSFDGGHFEMYRRGEFCLTRPWAYSDSGTVDGLGSNNSLLLGNQPINFQRREMLGAGEANGAFFLVQAHGGPWQHGNVRTAEYVHSFKRWLVWIPGESDVLLVRDALDISQPSDQTADRKAYNIGRAADRHAEYIASQGTENPIPLIQWILHAPVKPEVLPGHAALQWTTPGGQQVRLTTLVQPTLMHVRLIDEVGLYGRGVDAKEIGWQVRLIPAQVLDEEVGQPIELLHALVVSDAGAVPPEIAVEGGKVKVGERVVSWTETGIEVSP